jgi:catechol 2,3-dioxygenase-like lactoylglutathione lyase family enzyme
MRSVIYSVNHVGITASDLESSAAFYRDVVGFALVRRGTRPAEGDWFDTLTGSHHAATNAIVLATEGFAPQLVQYLKGGQPDPMTAHNRVGNLHLCINVEDLNRKHA